MLGRSAGLERDTFVLTIVVATTILTAMASKIAQQLKQESPFSSMEQEVFLGMRLAAARLLDPWATFLKSTAKLTSVQYNVLRVLRGSHPAKLACGDLGDRLIARDPDITRLVDRLGRRGLVKRSPGRKDRRVIEVAITDKGLGVLRELDAHVERMPKALLGHLGGERLRQLRRLLEAVISGRGTFP